MKVGRKEGLHVEKEEEIMGHWLRVERMDAVTMEEE